MSERGGGREGEFSLHVVKMPHGPKPEMAFPDPVPYRTGAVVAREAWPLAAFSS
jgi:hypothetical protein